MAHSEQTLLGLKKSKRIYDTYIHYILHITTERLNNKTARTEVKSTARLAPKLPQKLHQFKDSFCLHQL